MIVLVDTSVFLNIINLPGFNQNRDSVVDEFKMYIENDVSLLLPLVVFFEAGNHIGHLSDGNLRRDWAQKLVDVAKGAIVEKTAPWVPTPFPDSDQFMEMISNFPESAVAGCGLGDHSIICELRNQRLKFPGREVTVWSLDAALAAHA